MKSGLDEIVPELVEYIKIPNKSPHFDPDWEQHGYMEDAVQQIHNWCAKQDIVGLTTEIVRLRRAHAADFHGNSRHQWRRCRNDTVLLYGHLDKQPEMTGWADGLGPWIPVIRDDKLYGRGGADDGYAAYGSLTAIMAVQREQLPHTRCVVIIEACEESGSYDLPFYIDHLQDRIGNPSLVVCLDSGAGNYEQLWLTVSLRGMAAGTLRADVLKEGVHSGYASGVVPSSFRVLRQLLARLEDENTGQVLPDYLHADIPEQRIEQTRRMAEELGDEIWQAYPVRGRRQAAGRQQRGPHPQPHLAPGAVLHRRGRHAGAGLTPATCCGPYTSLKLSMRLPPTIGGEEATRNMKKTLEADPPENARVSFEADQAATGWNAPAVAPWLHDSLERASQAAYGRSVMYMGEGGTIPFMAMLGDAFPEAQFMITGVLGPKSNAHGPNEFLHIPFARRLTTCVAQVLTDHAQRKAAAKAA